MLLPVIQVAIIKIYLATLCYEFFFDYWNVNLICVHDNKRMWVLWRVDSAKVQIHTAG